MKKLVAFIDRDGTLIVGPPAVNQVDSLEKLTILPGAIDGLRTLREAGYALVMVSNQDALGTELFPRADFQVAQNRLMEILEEQGIRFEETFFCPHLPEESCPCRKPKTGLVDGYLAKNDIDLSQSLMIGDRDTDEQFARKIGVRFIKAEWNIRFPLKEIRSLLRPQAFIPLSMSPSTSSASATMQSSQKTSATPPTIPLYRNRDLNGAQRTRIFRRAQTDIEKIMPDVRKIIEAVKNGGDTAIVEYVRKFDNPAFRTDQIRVSKDDIAKAYRDVPEATLSIMKRQIEISRNFHQKQAERIFADADWSTEFVPGVRTGIRKGPIDSSGLYVPAGKAPLPTVSQILTVAAKAARVPRICVFFPPTAYYPEIIVAADQSGADEIYRVGGVAAIAAMAYGTQSIKPVDIIAGPGSPWVQAAKLQVFGQVGIDMLSGPSEGMGMVDDTANPAWVAADILARCEHGPDSCFPIVTTSKNIAEAIQLEVARQAPLRSRYEQFIRKALGNGYQAIILVESIDEMIDVANEYGAEHLHIQVRDAQAVSRRIRNAGSIFIGPYAPVPVGDYASGTNHCLPTSRAVAYSSPVSVETFIKTNEYQILTKEGLEALAPIVRTISDVEGLDAHKEAVDIRLRS